MPRITIPRAPTTGFGGAYGPGQERSWFLDTLYAYTPAESLPMPPPIVGGQNEARERVEAEQRFNEASLERLWEAEQRDLSTTVTAGGYFMNGGAPKYVGDAFAEAVRANSVMTSILPTEPLPETGMVLTTTRVTTATSAAVQASENGATSETDLVEATATSPVATIEGHSDASMQLFDRADPSFADVLIARELGRSLAFRLDAQILGGTGLNAQMVGLTAVSGIGTTTYDDASPTQQEAFVQFLKAAADQSVSLGQAPDVLLMHPRRRYWMHNWRDAATGVPAVIPWPATPTDVPGIPTTSEYALLLRTDELPVYLGPVSLRIVPDWSGSGTLTMRVQVIRYASNLFARRPEAIMKISGTGLADSPTFA